MKLEFDEVKRYLPHRAPFLLIDRVLEIRLKEGTAANTPVNQLSTENMQGTFVKAVRAVSGNEPFFAGHFPDFAVMPGVLVIEAMAQATSFTIYPFVKAMYANTNVKAIGCILVGADNVRFRKPVLPGDQLVITAEVVRIRGSLYSFRCEAFVDDKKAAEADLLAQLTGS